MRLFPALLVLLLVFVSLGWLKVYGSMRWVLAHNTTTIYSSLIHISRGLEFSVQDVLHLIGYGVIALAVVGIAYFIRFAFRFIGRLMAMLSLSRFG